MFGDIRNQVGELLDYSFAPGKEGSRDLIVIGHGVTANKDRAWATTLADALNTAGFATLRFSFAGNGDSEGDFGASCPSKEAADLHSVLAITKDWEITYVGHSMGGAVGVMAASHDAQIQRLVSLAGMVDTADFAKRKFGDLQAGKDCMWEKPECPLSQEFLDDMEHVHSVEPLGHKVHVPWLLIHGTADTVVPIAESERIQRHAPSTSSLIVMEDVDHVFSDDAAEVMAQYVVRWLS